MMGVNRIMRVMAMALPLLVMSCASGKVIGQNTQNGQSSQTTQTTQSPSEPQTMSFMHKVYDNQVLAGAICSKANITLKKGDKEIPLSGTVSMKRDEVIRIQLTPMGLVEVGRLELTPDYVLIIDRVHKEYVKADYNELAFLKRNGLNFYSLQAMFWNHLFVPGEKAVGEALLSSFTVDSETPGLNAAVTLQNNKMGLKWMAEKMSGRINEADATYTDARGTSVLQWKYSDFRKVNGRMFPAMQVVTFTSDLVKNGDNAGMTIEMKNVTTEFKGETQTTVSSKYTEVGAEELFNKIVGK